MAAPRGKPSAIRREIASSSSGVTSICIMPPPPPPPPASPPIMACMCMCVHVHVHVHVACACCACMCDGATNAHLQHLGVDPKLRHRLGRLQHLLHLGRLHQLPDDGTHTRWGYKQAIGQERSVGGAVAASGNMMRLESNVALQGPS